MSLFQYIPGHLLFEQKSKEIPKSIQRSAKRVAELYKIHAKGMRKLLRDINAYDVSNEVEWQSYFDKESVSHILPLTTISFVETNIKIKCQVIVVYSKQAKTQIEYDPLNQYLLLYDVNAKRLSENNIEAAIIKELVSKHNSDKKSPIRYKKIPSYKKAL